MTNQSRRNRRGRGGLFAERRTRVRRMKDRLTSRGVFTAQEAGTEIQRVGNPRSRSITRQLKAQRKKK